MNLDAPDASETAKKRFASLSGRMKYSVRLDEKLTGFQWDNPTYRLTRSLYDKYQFGPATAAHAAPSPEGPDPASQRVDVPSTAGPAESVS
jgi:hypothetical protein